MNDPRGEPGPTLNEKIELQTVNNKLRTATLFGVVAGALIAGALRITGSRRVWFIAVPVSILVLSGAMYFLLK